MPGGKKYDARENDTECDPEKDDAQCIQGQEVFEKGNIKRNQVRA
jgi:hypothetical protein